MDKKSENRDFWIGRILVIILFFFICSAFTDNNCKNKNPVIPKTASEYVAKIENAGEAIFSPLPDYNNSLSSNVSKLLNTDTENRLITLNHNKKINVFVKIYADIFIKIKPSILYFFSYLTNYPIPNKDYILIS